MNNLSLRHILATFQSQKCGPLKCRASPGHLCELLHRAAPTGKWRLLWAVLSVLAAPGGCHLLWISHCYVCATPSFSVAGVLAAEQCHAMCFFFPFFFFSWFLFCFVLHRPQKACGCRLIVQLSAKRNINTTCVPRPPSFYSLGHCFF